MFTYNESGTIRLFWNIVDLRLFGVHVNEYEPPELEPEENTYLNAMNTLKCTRELVRIHTFNIIEDSEVISKLQLILNNLEKYFGFVEVDNNGNYSGLYVSDEKPDPSAIFNMDTREWELPENILEIVKDRKLVELISDRNNSIDNIGAEYNGLHYYADKGSKSDIHFAITAYDKTGELPHLWKGIDGVLQSPTYEDILGIAISVGNYTESQYQKEFELATMVHQATTVDEINSIKW